MQSRAKAEQGLALDTTEAVATGQFLHLSNGNHIVVALNGVFQC